jgi:hypothetical protein
MKGERVPEDRTETFVKKEQDMEVCVYVELYPEKNRWKITV